MGAVLSYNGFSHAAGENVVNITRRGWENASGFVIGYIETWSITGVLQAETLADLKTAWEEIETAYATQNADLAWTFDGTAAHEMNNDDTVYGVKIVSPPQYPDGGGPGELVNRRSYTIVAEGVYLFPASLIEVDGEPYITNYESSFSTTGTGGATFAHIPLIAGKFQKQLLTTHSLVTGQQTGSAVGLGRYPTPDAPFSYLADYEKVDRRQIRQGTPRRINNVNVEYPIFWVYTFERNEPFPVQS